jgi:hypothetical protein
MPATLGYYPYHVKYKGLVDLVGLYKMIKKWFDDRGFYFEEKEFTIRPGEGAGPRQKIVMTAWLKMTDYVKHSYFVDLFTWDMEEVPVEKEGRKEIWYNCRVYIRITGQIDLDWEGRWEDSEFHIELRRFFNRYMFKTDSLIVHWDKMNYKALILHNEIKKFLGMHTSKAYYDYL